MPSEENIYKNAINHTMIYGASNILRKVVGLIMLPIYTQYLTPEDYAVVDLMMLTIVLVEVFLSMRMGQAVFRFYHLAESENEKKKVMSTGFVMAIFTGTAAYIVLAMNADSAVLLMIGDSQYKELFSLLAILLLLQSIEEFGFIYLRIHQKANLYFVLSFVKLSIQLSLNIYFIVYLELSVAGVVYTAIISTAFMSLFAVFYTFYYSGLSFSKKTIKDFVLFSYPMWISAIGIFYANSSVKYFLRVFSGLEDVGLYALAAQFGSLVVLFSWIPFTSVWDSLKYQIYKKNDSKYMYNNILIILVVVMSFIGLGVSLFSDIIIRFMSPEAFWPAGEVVPILAMLSIIVGLTQFNNLGILIEKKTSYFAIIVYSKAVILTICFVLFIPYLGLYGAALAVLLGGVFHLYLVEKISNKYYDMELQWSRVIGINLLWVICYLLSLLLPEGVLISIIGRFAILLVFVLFVFLTPILKKEEKATILGYVKNGYFKLIGYSH